MTTFITDENEIIDWLDNLEKVLKYHLKEEEEFSFRVHGVRFSTTVNHNFDIWYASHLIEKKGKNPIYWNALGLYECLDKQKCNNIVIIEINAEKATDKNAKSVFAKNEDDEVEIIISGSKIIDWYRKNFPENIKIIFDGKKKKEVISIGAISSPDFIENLSKFMRNFARIKEYVSV